MANEYKQVEHLLAGLTDTSGNPLVGGKVYTYEAGTTTQKATYLDSNGTQPATNPIVLDSNGRANVYAKGLYKFVIKDANDVTLYTWDFLNYGVGLTEQDQTISGVKTFSNGIKTDTVDEVTTGNGVVVDGVKCKDNEVYADAIQEKTTGAGVTIGGPSSSTDDVKVASKTVYTDKIAERTTGGKVSILNTLNVSPIETDTINEKTLNNGVTIDGVNIKDGKIATSNSVEPLALAKGMYGIAYNGGGNTTSATFVTVKTIKIYVPVGANVLSFYFEGYTSVGTAGAYFRAKIGTDTSASVNTSSTTAVWLGPDDLNLSANGNWFDLELQAHSDGTATATLTGFSYFISS